MGPAAEGSKPLLLGPRLFYLSFGQLSAQQRQLVAEHLQLHKLAGVLLDQHAEIGDADSRRVEISAKLIVKLIAFSFSFFDLLFDAVWVHKGFAGSM